MFDLYLMIAMGVLAYFMNIAKIPAAPLLLAFVLTPMLESYVRQAFDISGGSFGIFLQSGISKTLLTLIIIFCLAPLVMNIINKKKTASGQTTTA